MNGSSYVPFDQPVRRQMSPMHSSALRYAPIVGRGNGVDTDSAQAHAIAVMRKLAVCLDEEIEALVATPLADLTSFSGRKGQALMELNRVMAACGQLEPGSAIAAELKALRGKIDENMRVLRLHVAAVKEIAGTMTDAIRNEESDGTYSPSIQGKHGARW